MRRTFLLTFIALCGYFTASGQYKLNMTKYKTNDYSYQLADPYNPILCGVASYLMPGLGQMIAGETRRGLTFTSVYFAGATVAVTGFLINPLDPNIRDPRGVTGVALLASGMTIVAVTGVWSIIDAVKVAKINNLAYRDKKGTTLKMRFHPYFVGHGSIESDVLLGTTLTVNF